MFPRTEVPHTYKCRKKPNDEKSPAVKPHLLMTLLQLPITDAISKHHNLVRKLPVRVPKFLHTPHEKRLQMVSDFLLLEYHLAVPAGHAVVHASNKCTHAALHSLTMVDVNADRHPLFEGETDGPQTAAELADHLVGNLLGYGTRTLLVHQSF